MWLFLNFKHQSWVHAIDQQYASDNAVRSLWIDLFEPIGCIYTSKVSVSGNISWHWGQLSGVYMLVRFLGLQNRVAAIQSTSKHRNDDYEFYGTGLADTGWKHAKDC